jgi:hypothetical protein
MARANTFSEKMVPGAATGHYIKVVINNVVNMKMRNNG